MIRGQIKKRQTMRRGQIKKSITIMKRSLDRDLPILEHKGGRTTPEGEAMADSLIDEIDELGVMASILYGYAPAPR